MFSQIISWLKPVSLSQLARQAQILQRTRLFVSYYYYVTPLLGAMFLGAGLHNKPNFEPIYPLYWSTYFELSSETTILLIKVALVVSSLAAAFFHQHRWSRILFFVALWQVHALESSFGHWNHQWYTWLYTSFIFIFLPNIWESKDTKKIRDSLLVIWTAQAFVMLTYTMAGINKFVKVFEQYMAGEVHGLARDAFLYQTAWWVPQLQQPAYFINLIAQFPNLAWLCYASLHFIQLFALWTMVRTSLQPLWTFLLIMFHLGTFVSMGILFTEHLLLLLVLFLPTPLILGRLTWQRVLFDIPVVGWVLSHAKVHTRRYFPRP
ncbi:MAG: hypothetical protein R3B69_01840 [Candidatus Paceibacterota bacterium]